MYVYVYVCMYVYIYIYIYIYTEHQWKGQVDKLRADHRAHLYI